MREPRGLWLAPGVDPELGAVWQREFADWFDAGRPGLPGVPSERLVLVDSPLGTLVAKRDRTRGPKRWLTCSGLRAAHGLHAFRVGRAMGLSGVACAEPLAYVQRRGRAPALDGVLLSRHVLAPDPWSFLELEGDFERALAELIEALAKGISELHRAGFRHPDLKAPNLLIERLAPAAQPRALFIDLEAARGPLRIRGGQITRDLARLAASFRSGRALQLGMRDLHWERLLRAYFEHSPATSLKLAPTLLATRRWADAHIARNLARGRPLS